MRIKWFFVVVFTCLIFDNCLPRGHWPPKVRRPRLPHASATPVSIGSAQPIKFAYECARAVCFCCIFRLGASWGHLGPSGGHLGPSGGRLGASWGHHGAILGPSWAILGRPWGNLWPKMAHMTPKKATTNPKFHNPKPGGMREAIKHGRPLAGSEPC